MTNPIRVIRDRRGRPPIGAATGQRLHRLVEDFRTAGEPRRVRIGKALGSMGFTVTAAGAEGR